MTIQSLLRACICPVSQKHLIHPPALPNITCRGHRSWKAAGPNTKHPPTLFPEAPPVQNSSSAPGTHGDLALFPPGGRWRPPGQSHTHQSSVLFSPRTADSAGRSQLAARSPGTTLPGSLHAQAGSRAEIAALCWDSLLLTPNCRVHSSSCHSPGRGTPCRAQLSALQGLELSEEG